MKLITFGWVPEFAQGYVKDIPVRWALEEMGLKYELYALKPGEAKSDEYRRKQPFGQVPVLEDNGAVIFESGSILLHLGEKSPKLLPVAPLARARARTWVIAALNSVEPYVTAFIRVDDHAATEAWAKERRPAVFEALVTQLRSLEKWMEGRMFLEDEFTVGDIMMVIVIRHLVDSGVLAQFPNLNRYRERCEARPAFKKALLDHFQTFKENAPA